MRGGKKKKEYKKKVSRLKGFLSSSEVVFCVSSLSLSPHSQLKKGILSFRLFFFSIRQRSDEQKTCFKFLQRLSLTFYLRRKEGEASLCCVRARVSIPRVSFGRCVSACAFHCHAKDERAATVPSGARPAGCRCRLCAALRSAFSPR